MIDQFPGELTAFIGGMATYLLFYFFGRGRQPGLRQQKPSFLFGALALGIALSILLMAVIAAVHTNTPLRKLADNHILPRFVRDGYWFSIFLMPTGFFEILRAWRNSGK
jgi:hypothetical protein